jgi:hypothetical protein
VVVVQSSVRLVWYAHLCALVFKVPWFGIFGCRLVVEPFCWSGTVVIGPNLIWLLYNDIRISTVTVFWLTVWWIMVNACM